MRATDRPAGTARLLAPPPDVVLVRPLRLKVTAGTATVMWWTAGIVTASCAGMVVVEPVLSRAVAGPLLVVALVAFVVATVAQVAAGRQTARLVDRDLEAREAAAAAAWLAEPHESLAVIEAVAEELAADAAEAAATAAVRAAALAARAAQHAADAAEGSEQPEDARFAARFAVVAADAAAQAVGQIPGARRPDEVPFDGSRPFDEDAQPA